MTLRWLWMDHVPPELDLTRAERKQVRRMAAAHRRRDPKYYGAHLIRLQACIPILAVAFLVLSANSVWIQRIPAPGIVMFMFVLYPGMAWAMHRSRRPFIRKALIDCGHPVCMYCGYILRGVEDDRCPECGELRIRTHHESLDPSDRINPAVVEVMMRLGYAVCPQCGAMWFEGEPLPKCPQCTVNRISP